MRDPFSSPNSDPNSRYAISDSVTPAPTKITKVMGEEVKSAIESLFTANKKAIPVRMSAHWPNGAFDVGERSKTIPAKKPVTREPL